MQKPWIAVVSCQVPRLDTGPGDLRIVLVSTIDQVATERQKVVAGRVHGVTVPDDPRSGIVGGQAFGEVERLFLNHDQLTDGIVLCCITVRSYYIIMR